MLACREVIGFLYDYLEGELPPSVRLKFRAHLLLCASCRAYIASYEATIRMSRESFSEDDVEAPPEELVRVILTSRE
ncbi:MAG TPA: zf-HC2 domain-containing protein [Thermoanaerobaculia bacterium]|jgi:anti-sigma factor RsiW